MSKKIKISAIVVIVVIAMVVMLRPEKKDSLMQHKTWARESKETTGLDEEGNLATHLPVVILHTKGERIPGEDRTEVEKLSCEYSIIFNEDGVNRSDDEPYQSGKAQISIRGNSSRDFPKKQYSIKLIDDMGMGANEPLLDMPAGSSWTLNGSYIDKSQIRNYLLYHLSSFMSLDAPRCRLCEVMIENEEGDLEYQGLYTLFEKVKVSKNRLNLTNYDPSYAETSFLLQTNSNIDNLEVRHLMKTFAFTYQFDLEYPSAEELTQPSYDYIQENVVVLEKTLFDAERSGEWGKVHEMIDMDSFVDYFLVNEFFQNYDAGRRSTYIYKNVGEKFTMGPVWDFDGAFDNFMDLHMPVDELKMRRQFYYAYLMQDPAFVNRCIERFKELRGTYLSEEYLLSLIDETVDYLGEAPLRNCDKWYEGDHSAYYDDVEDMKNYIKRRGKWMDENFERKCTIIDWKENS